VPSSSRAGAGCTGRPGSGTSCCATSGRRRYAPRSSKLPDPGHDETAPTARRQWGPRHGTDQRQSDRDAAICTNRSSTSTKLTPSPLRVHTTLRIQRRSQRRRRPLRRIRGTILTTHPRIRIPRRGLPAEPFWARLPRRPLLAGIALLPTLPRRTAGTRNSRVRARLTRSPRRARHRRIRARPPRHTRSTRCARRRRQRRRRLPRRPGLPLLPARTRDAHTWLTPRPGRTRHRSPAQPLHLPGQRVDDGVI
jgi:hypothetical protein